MTDQLHALADRLGVEITYHPRGPKGLYIAELRTITLREGMGWRKLRSTLAHELGHAAHDDRPQADGVLRARQERAADVFAARLLITPENFARAEQLVGPHDGALAHELGVTTHIINVWRDTYARATT